MESKVISINRVVWEKTFQEQVCAKIPFDGTKCLTLTASVRLLEEGGKYYIELQLMGNRVKYEIGNVCYPVFTVGIGRLTVCTSDIKIANNKLSSIKITVKGCVGADVGPIHIEKCWNLLNQVINFFALTTGKLNHMNETVIENYNDIVYIELDDIEA